MAYLLAVAGLAAMLGFVKVMDDMSAPMGRMTDSVEAMAADIKQMNVNMASMAAAVAGIRQSVDRMGRVVDQGGQQIERMNPMRVMEGLSPTGGSH